MIKGHKRTTMHWAAEQTQYVFLCVLTHFNWILLAVVVILAIEEANSPEQMGLCVRSWRAFNFTSM